MHNQPDFQPAILVPVYNHEAAIPTILERLLPLGLPILLVDDGSNEQCQRVLGQLADAHSNQVALVRLDSNGGKGAAVKAGMRWLFTRGYTHAVQIDADGQHDSADVATFLTSAKHKPDQLVTGYPTYDETVPKIRYYARYLTHIWIWINTLSLQIKDSMCGFRVYPLQKVLPILNSCGERMDFDPEVIVRWAWGGGQVINIPTKVHYPLDGVSHFLLWKDNSLITAMHTRLFFGMLIRLPKLIQRKLNG